MKQFLATLGAILAAAGIIWIIYQVQESNARSAAWKKETRQMERDADRIKEQTAETERMRALLRPLPSPSPKKGK